MTSASGPTSHVQTEEAESCRILCGPAGYKGLTTALEHGSYLAHYGVTMAIPVLLTHIEILTDAAKVSLPYAHLSHPRLVNSVRANCGALAAVLFPTDFERARTSVKPIKAAYAGFVTGMTGTEHTCWMQAELSNMMAWRWFKHHIPPVCPSYTFSEDSFSLSLSFFMVVGQPTELQVFFNTHLCWQRVMGPLNPGCFDCFPLACPVLASFSTSFSTYAFPFQILCLDGTRFLPNWHKFFWLIAATYIAISRREESPYMVVNRIREVSPKCPKHSGFGIVVQLYILYVYIYIYLL